MRWSLKSLLLHCQQASTEIDRQWVPAKWQVAHNAKEKDVDMLEHLDEIAREAWHGNYERVGPLSTGERLYVALASGRMRELAPSDSIAYAVDRVGHEWMDHMLQVWRGSPQPKD